MTIVVSPSAYDKDAILHIRSENASFVELLKGESPSLRAQRNNPFFLVAERWIASSLRSSQ